MPPMNTPTPNRSPNRLLILGANGKLGQLLRRAWAQTPLAGWQPIWCARAPGVGIDVVWRPGAVAPMQADAVLALWGMVPGAGDLEINSHLAAAAMALGRASGAARVLHCSSAAVYGPGAALHEDMTCQPSNAYGTAKLAMEAAIRQDSNAHPDGPQACALRLANVVGADSLFAALDSPAAMVIDRFASGQGPQRSYAPPSTILHAVGALLMADPLPEILNVAACGTVGMDALTKAAGKSFSWRPAPKTALGEVMLDTTRLQTLTGDTSPTDAEALIAEWRALREVTP